MLVRRGRKRVASLLPASTKETVLGTTQGALQPHSEKSTKFMTCQYVMTYYVISQGSILRMSEGGGGGVLCGPYLRYASRCPASQQQKLLSSTRVGAPKAPTPEECVFFLCFGRAFTAIPYDRQESLQV